MTRWLTRWQRFTAWAAARRARKLRLYLEFYGPSREDPNPGVPCRCGQRFPSYNGSLGLWRHQLKCPACPSGH